MRRTRAAWTSRSGRRDSPTRDVASDHLTPASGGARMTSMAEPLGARFAHAVASKDPSRVRELLHPEIDFRAMTPSRFWEPPTPDDVLEMLCQWFEPGDVIEAVEKV